MKNLGKYISFAIGGVLLLWLILSSYGAFHNFISWDAQQAGFWWKIPTTILYIVCAGIFYALATDKMEITGKTVGSGVLILALAVCCSTGFKFTGGDIKQRVTCTDLNGKVDPDCLFKYYDGFYHFSTDTALKAYVLQYKELPGVNNWAFNIREHKTDSSRAPRANEDFQWHTGAYEK